MRDASFHQSTIPNLPGLFGDGTPRRRDWPHTAEKPVIKLGLGLRVQGLGLIGSRAAECEQASWIGCSLLFSRHAPCAVGCCKELCYREE